MLTTSGPKLNHTKPLSHSTTTVVFRPSWQRVPAHREEQSGVLRVIPLYPLCWCYGGMRKIWQYSCTMYNCQFDNHCDYQNPPYMTVICRPSWEIAPRSQYMGGMLVWMWSYILYLMVIEHLVCVWDWSGNNYTVLKVRNPIILYHRVTESYIRISSTVAKVHHTERIKGKVVWWG